MTIATANFGHGSKYCGLMTRKVTTQPMIKTENFVQTLASRFVVRSAEPSKFVIPPKKLDPMLAIQITS